ncbi:MFS transporter [Kordiimonas pumila]|uniref:MFS transporter n=1 Tax=Kordiimonas pumila TaxID=2161677 RepID=A0ABV7D8R4_9PROT|nr:MFS transporter [Kordiimonas pumila]
MTLRSTVIGISALLTGAGALHMGMSLQGTLVGVRAGIENFPAILIGLIMSGYYAGFVAGSVYAPKIVNKVGHIRTFSAFASLASAAALCHSVFVDPVSWLVFRALAGFCFAVLSLVTESWLNERSSNLNRGTVLAVYFMVVLMSAALGQIFLIFASPAGYDLFILISVIISIALVPIALTSMPTPAVSEPHRMSLAKLYKTSPVGVVGCCGAGLVSGSYGALGAVFAQAKGLATTEIAIFMFLLVAGGAVAQWPLGRLSDRMDRRYVLVGLTITATILGVAVWVDVLQGILWLYTFGALMGAMLLSMYGVAIAHANDFLEPHEFVPASASLLLIYGLGAILGPIIAAAIMGWIGPNGLFIYLAVFSGIVALFTIYRMTQRSVVPSDDSTDFVLAQGISPVAFELDPRAEADDEASA